MRTEDEYDRLKAQYDAILRRQRIKPIRTDEDHKAALARIDALMDAKAGTAEADELDVLATLVVHYEHVCAESQPQDYMANFKHGPDCDGCAYDCEGGCWVPVR